MKVWKYGNQKPPLGAQINWGSARARDIASACLLSEGAGSATTDLARQISCAFVGTALFAADGVNFGGTAGRAVNIGSGGRLALPGSYSIAARIRAASFTDYYRIMDCATGGMQFYVGANGRLGGYIAGICTDTFSANDVLVAEKTHDVALVVQQGAGVFWYVDGVVVKTYVSAGIPTAGTGIHYLGNRSSDGARPFPGVIIHAYKFTCALSAAEVADLYTQPYGNDLYLVPGPRVWAIPLGVPPMMDHYRRLRVGA